MSASTRIDAIQIADRHRKDFGDIDSLAASIADVGLLQPVVITADLRLIAGERRIRACQQLGWDTIPTRIAANLTEAADLLRAERDENTCREPFKPTEAESVAAAIEAVLKPVKEEERKAKISHARSDGAKLAPSPKTRQIAASGTGYSAETIRKVRETKKVAESPTTPAPVRKVAVKALEDMDRTGKVDGAHKQVKVALTAADYITKYPDLEHYSDRPEQAATIGRILDGVPEAERPMRIDTLRKSIAREKRLTQQPTPEPEVDLLAQVTPIFNAVNALSSTIARCGGVAAIKQALATANPLLITTWHEQFAQVATTLAVIAEETKPTLRRIK